MSSQSTAPAHHLLEALQIGLTVPPVRRTLTAYNFNPHFMTDAPDVTAKHHMAADHRTGRPVGRCPEAARGARDSLALIHDSCAEIVVAHGKERTLVIRQRCTPPSAATVQVVRNVQNILQTNCSVVSSLGPPFLSQMSLVYVDMLNVYRYG